MTQLKMLKLDDMESRGNSFHLTHLSKRHIVILYIWLRKEKLYTSVYSLNPALELWE